MSPPSPNSKFHFDAALFKPEPPINRKLTKKLFVARKVELVRGLETLRRNLDLRGHRSKKHDKRPWVIHGESRSGKSHLARRIMADLPFNNRRHQIVILARERLEASVVIKSLFEFLSGFFTYRIDDQTLSQDLRSVPAVQLVLELIDKNKRFLTGAEDQTITVEQTDKKAAEAGIQTGVKVLTFLGKFQSETTEKQALQVKLRKPTPLELAEVCSILVQTLLDLGLIDHILVLVDDVDLLEGYVSPERNARIQRSVLAEALNEFHATPAVDVVLTARSWYAHSQKEFQTLVDLANAHSLTTDELVRIHDVRYAAFGGSRAPSAFLTRQALATAAKDVLGLPGVLLQHLDTSFQAYQAETEWGERDYDWYLKVFKRRYDTCCDKCPAAAEALREAIRAKRLNLSVLERNPFYGTVFENEFVYQSYYSESTYFVTPLLYKLATIPDASGSLPLAERS